MKSILLRKTKIVQQAQFIKISKASIYRDSQTGLTLNIRNGDFEIRIFGKLINLKKLEKLLKEAD